jgi:hypothetical protein
VSERRRQRAAVAMGSGPGGALPLSAMPDELVRFTPGEWAPAVPGASADDMLTLGIIGWRQWREQQQAWLKAHAPGTTWLDLDAERRRRWPAVP